MAVIVEIESSRALSLPVVGSVLGRLGIGTRIVRTVPTYEKAGHKAQIIISQEEDLHGGRRGTVAVVRETEEGDVVEI